MFFEEFEIIDLTHTIVDNMYHFKGDPIPQIRQSSTIEVNGWNVSQFTLGSHSGTHVDAPSHIINGGTPIDKIEPVNFFGNAIVMDLHYKQPNEPILVEDLKIAETLDTFDTLLLFTGMSNNWGKEEYLTAFPYLSLEAAKYIVNLKIKILGIDWMTIEKFGGDGSVHKEILSNNIIIVENLVNLDKIKSLKVYFACFPLKIENLDGAPTRALAFVPKNNRQKHFFI